MKTKVKYKFTVETIHFSYTELTVSLEVIIVLFVVVTILNYYLD